ncbi:MAG TPA: GreA/GreB family elongation factor [Candidatus Saccharimonadales bacterium]|nr:GreA/GreB family elongation factor [Candidatus Saccharimonadales bacterium]
MKTTITDKTILLSKKGMKELRKSVAQLEHDLQKALQNLRELDKTTGRDERLSRIEKLATIELIETELADKKLTLSNAKLLPSKPTRLQVAVGSVVELIDKHGHLFRYTIVESVEANPSDGRISTLSPLGQSLIGKTVRDIIQWGNGANANQFRLIRIV